jgi:hypothetical protein
MDHVNTNPRRAATIVMAVLPLLPSQFNLRPNVANDSA